MAETTPTPELRILMLEDTPSDAMLMEHELRKEGIVFTVHRVTTRGAFDQALSAFHPDIVLSDFNLPAFTGMDALHMVRRDYPDLPVIMVTGALPDIEAVELIHAGANDYVLKDRLARLPSAIQRALAEAQEARTRKLAEKKYRTLFSEALDGIALIDCATWRIADCNPAFEKQTGYTLAQLQAITAWEVLVPEQQGTGQQALLDIQKTERGRGSDFTFQKPDGQLVPFEFSAKLITIQRQSFVQCIVRDISERKQAEEALRRANRALKTLSAGNLALVQATTEEELLHNVTQVIVEEGGYSLAVVDYLGEPPAKAIIPKGWSGMEKHRYWAKGMSWGDNERGQLPVARAIRDGMTQCSSDLDDDPTFAPWREEALARGYRSNIALPLRDGKQVFGALSIYAAQIGAFDQPREIKLLEELANDLAYGIMTLRTRVAHEQHAILLRQSLEQSIQVIAATVEARDPYTAGHQQRVADLATAIARAMGVDEEQANGIHLAASIHDLGKIHIPAEILSKPGRLTKIEFALIKEHPQSGHDILAGVDLPWPIAQIILQHHERLNGSGYPQGLKEEQILFEAKILAVADVVEAMSSHRPYRPGLGIEAALEEIQSHSGTLYDPAVVDACVTMFRKGEYEVAP